MLPILYGGTVSAFIISSLPSVVSYSGKPEISLGAERPFNEPLVLVVHVHIVLYPLSSERQHCDMCDKARRNPGVKLFLCFLVTRHPVSGSGMRN